MKERQDLLSTSPKLLNAFREGKRDAMKAVYEAYEPLVRTIACRGFSGFSGFRSASEIDDAVASVFVAAFQPQARLRYDGVGPYHAWISGIARNTIRALRRRNGSRQLVPLTEELLPSEEHSGDDPETLVAHRDDLQLSQRFQAFLKDPFLQAVCRDVLARGEPEQAVAHSLGVTRHQVRKALHTIRRRIAQFLRQEGLS